MPPMVILLYIMTDGSGAKSLSTVTMEIHFHAAYGYTAVDYG